MPKLISCEFNIDTNRVELVYSDGKTILIDTTAVENEYAEDMYQRSELDWLKYNAPLKYAKHVLVKDIQQYLSKVVEYNRLD